MTGLPKKYAQMGFKRGWKAFKSKSRNAQSVSKVSKLARRRSFRKSASRFARRAARRSGVGNSASLLQVDAMAYGALRGYASDAIAPLTAKIPFATVADEVGMGLLCWAVSKYAGKGMLGSIARKGLVIENARVGQTLSSGLPQLSIGTSSSDSYM